MSSKRGAGDVSASVEESNELRKKLGIKPLDTKETTAASGSSKNPKAPEKADTKLSEADIKKQKAAARNKREHEDLTKGKGLGDILEIEEGGGDAADWVSKTRGKDGSMKTSAGSTVQSSSSKRRKGDADAEITKVPKMKVRHDHTDIKDGEQVTLVLSDKPILNKQGEIDETPEELSNVRLMDAEKARHNDAIRNQRDYDPDKEGQDILDKYNELQTGPAGFVIGGQGVIDETDPEKRLTILTTIAEKQTLEAKTRLQKDYYTAEEMNKFRKPPKKRVKRRANKESRDKDDQIGGAAPFGDAGRPHDAGSDEEDPELYEQLSKQRRLVRRSDAGAVKKGEAALTAVSERVQAIDKEDDEEEKEKVILGNKPGTVPGDNIAMTATTEFCNVVQTPLEKIETLKHESFHGSSLYKQQATTRKGIKVTGQKKRNPASGSAGILDDEAGATGQQDDDDNLHEECLDLSCASGLAYLRARAQIGNDQETHKNRKSDNRPLEMSTLDGDIKLEYRDDYGRVQTPKEAFRAISWKFHGKMPGRKNLERRLLRLETEMKLKAMDPVNQLPTLRALRHVQRADAKPYMVLSGANEK